MSNLKTVFIQSPKGGPDGGPIKINFNLDKDEKKQELITPHTFIGNLERPHTIQSMAQGLPKNSLGV